MRGPLLTLPLGGPQLPWVRGGWLSGTAGCVLTSLAPCALEPQHGSGSGLVPGPAAAPLRVKEEEIHSANKCRLRLCFLLGSPTRSERRARGGSVLLGRLGEGWSGGGRGLCPAAFRYRADVHGRMDE